MTTFGSLDKAFVLSVGDDEMLAVLHGAAGGAPYGVLIVVGGPQYRVGSHRQFVLLARRLAEQGYPVLRFDARGSGDSSGGTRDFESIGEDLTVAIDSLCRESGARKIVLWGLCDGASAILLHTANDTRVAGMVLLNPWVHSQEGEARARLQSYYGARLRNPEFWRKLVSMKLDWRDSLGSFADYVRNARVWAKRVAGDVHYSRSGSFVERMRRAWMTSPAPALVILSGEDLTAMEFRNLVSSDPGWRTLMERGDIERLIVLGANHTFASAEWRLAVEEATLAWLRRLPA